MHSVYLLASVIAVVALFGLEGTLASPAKCSDGKTFCNGCQCCPDLKRCPSCGVSSFKCPNDETQGSGGSGSGGSTRAKCSDGKTNCDGCQCCPDLKRCPNCGDANFKCPNDGNSGDNTDGGSNSTDGNAHVIKIENRCPMDIWIGVLGTPLPRNGGWLMRQSDPPATVSLPLKWSGRFWGRTGCSTASNGQFSCVTGDCGRRLECSGAGGEPPATLAEFTFNANGGLDYYDVSLVDGYNLPMQIVPVDGTFVPGAGICQASGCNNDLNAKCPSELKKVYNGSTVACKSACAALNQDMYCCRGAYSCSPHGGCGPGGSIRCDPATWPINYAQIFKNACPTSYSYAYDDPSSTFTCLGKSQVNYNIIFCP